MIKLSVIQKIHDGALILEWLLIGYLFYMVHSTIAIYLFVIFFIGTGLKVIILREEEKIEKEFLEKLHENIEKEIENLDNKRE